MFLLSHLTGTGGNVYVYVYAAAGGHSQNTFELYHSSRLAPGGGEHLISFFCVSSTIGSNSSTFENLVSPKLATLYKKRLTISPV